MLGRLAKWLRIWGHDVTYHPSCLAGGLLDHARAQGRVVLTRNRSLLHKAAGLRIVLIESDHWREQLAQVVRLFRLRPGQACLSRCVICNCRLLLLPREQVEGRVPEFVLAQNRQFYGCPQCKRIFWPGSHAAAMTQVIGEIAGRARSIQEKGR
jgi:uncharacterized protein with PIN domain